MPHPHGGGLQERPGGSRGRDRSFFEGFDRERGGRFTDLLDQEFFPELERSRGRRSALEREFTRFRDPEAGEAFITRGAERIASDFLRPGGVATEAIRGARGQAISSGFGTRGGDLSRQESTIISEGLRSSVGSFIGQALPGLFEGAAGRTERRLESESQRSQDFLESIFTGLGSAESLRLASPGGGGGFPGAGRRRAEAEAEAKFGNRFNR